MIRNYKKKKKCVCDEGGWRLSLGSSDVSNLGPE